MVRCLKVKNESGDDVKAYLKKKDWLDASYVLGRTAQRYLIFALNKNRKENEILKQFPAVKFEDKNLQKLPSKQGNLKQLLSETLSEDMVNKVKRSYEIIGDVAILEIPPELEKNELSIAWALKRATKNLRVIVRKDGKVGGADKVYRLRKLKVLTGPDDLDVYHKEQGFTFHLDLRKAYFSPRMATERTRIARLVQPREEVLVMFAGIGPYAAVLARQEPSCSIIAVEKNPDAFRFMQDNFRINRLPNAHAMLGDVVDVLPKLGYKYDRIISVFPEKAWAFLDLTLEYLKPGGVCHFYVFLKEDELEGAIKKLEDKGVNVFNWVRAGAYAAKTWRYCIDFKT